MKKHYVQWPISSFTTFCQQSLDCVRTNMATWLGLDFYLYLWMQTREDYYDWLHLCPTILCLKKNTWKLRERSLGEQALQASFNSQPLRLLLRPGWLIPNVRPSDIVSVKLRYNDEFSVIKQLKTMFCALQWRHSFQATGVIKTCCCGTNPWRQIKSF